MAARYRHPSVPFEVWLYINRLDAPDGRVWSVERCAEDGTVTAWTFRHVKCHGIGRTLTFAGKLQPKAVVSFKGEVDALGPMGVIKP